MNRWLYRILTHFFVFCGAFWLGAVYWEFITAPRASGLVSVCQYHDPIPLAGFFIVLVVISIFGAGVLYGRFLKVDGDEE